MKDENSIGLVSFLDKQYFAIQQYTHRQEFNHVRIYRFNSQDINNMMQLLIDTSKPYNIKIMGSLKSQGDRE